MHLYNTIKLFSNKKSRRAYYNETHNLPLLHCNLFASWNFVIKFKRYFSIYMTHICIFALSFLHTRTNGELNAFSKRGFV